MVSTMHFQLNPQARPFVLEVAPGVTVGNLRRFRAALLGPIQGLPRRRGVGGAHEGDNPGKEYVVVDDMALCVDVRYYYNTTNTW